MEWDFFFNQDNRVLEVKVSGELTSVELNDMARENLVEIKKHDCYKCLLNYSEATKGLSIIDAYNRPKEVFKLGVTPQYRIAILVSKEQADNYRFLENVYRNSGYDFGIFTEREPAIGFLTKP